MSFNQARQGRGARLPRAGRAALCGCVIVGLSQLLYPRVHSDFLRPANTPERNSAQGFPAPLRGSDSELKVKVNIAEGPEFDDAFARALEILLNAGRGERQ